MKTKFILLLLICNTIFINAQEKQTEALDSVVVSSTRIDLPFKENSRTIEVVTAEDIKELGVTNVADALQQLAGIDVRRQGVNGMQADLYIRGGGFDQTLLLIDGIKVDDPQTGHHTMNLALPIEVIKRIEVIKGPAARIFGQNAFTGAVNIITKNAKENSIITKVQGGSFGQFIAEATGSINLKESNHIVHFSKHTSEGYRYNTDFDNTNFVLKSQLNKNKLPINLISAYSERKFGANGFYGYTNPEQYEETQASLLGLSTIIKNGNLTWKPRVYWRRNQDTYRWQRRGPSNSRNVHITNKFAAELNNTYKSKLGTTGFGFEYTKYFIVSNKLGYNSREMGSIFLEHRFQFFNDKLDIIPGVAASYFSDFDNKAFPGLDLGYQITTNLRAYGNVGYTYRVPTYNNLYYTDTETIGNENLQPEEAISQEIGLKWFTKRFDLSVAAFNRDSKDLIDYVKPTESDLYSPQNLQDVNTRGIEANFDYRFVIKKMPQKVKLGYTFMDDDIKESIVAFSKYSLNSMKHQFIGNLSTQWCKIFSSSIAYRYIERTSSMSSNLLDVNAILKLNTLELFVTANNIFNVDYIETGLVPMPPSNVLFGLCYNFE